MFNYTVRRLISAVPILFIVVFIVFFLVHLIPGDPASVMAGPEATADEIAELRSKLGLDEPLPLQFGKYVANLFRGDLGDSLHYNKPVVTALLERIEPTLIIVLYSISVASLIGIPLGVVAAIYRNRFIDKLAMVLSMVGVSTPGFWLGLNLVLLFCVYNKVFPSVGYIPIEEGGLLMSLYYLTLPSLALGLQRSASIARVTRSSMLDVLNNDYVRTARSKGLAERTVIFKHALKNAMIPILTQIGMSFARLAGGAVVIETIFNIPGVGQLAFDSIKRRDYPLIQGHILCIAAAYILINLVIDLLYKFFDPRVNYN